MMRSAIIAALFAAQPAAIWAQDAQPSEPAQEVQSVLDQRTDDVVQFLRGEKVAEDVFGPAFLAALPPEQIKAVASQLSDQYGQVVGVETLTPTGPFMAEIAIRYEKAIASGMIALSPDAPNPVEGLRFTGFAQFDDSREKVLGDIAELPGSVSAHYAPLDGGNAVLSVNPDTALAIGSTFKLYVLSALNKAIESGEHRWDEVVPLTVRSFPSGQMQDWPQGSPVTIHTLATMMISISDNTATDQLIALLGRERVEAELRTTGHAAPDATLPFLSTMEMFGLKGDRDRGKAFAAADEAGQRAILTKFAEDTGGDRDRMIAPTFTQPSMIDTLEWFASGQDLRKLLQRLTGPEQATARSIMAVNIVLPKSVRDQWRYVGYKGGSEPGVLNLTWLLQDKAETWHVLTLSWNNPDANVDLAKLLALAQRVIALPRE